MKGPRRVTKSKLISNARSQGSGTGPRAPGPRAQGPGPQALASGLGPHAPGPGPGSCALGRVALVFRICYDSQILFIWIALVLGVENDLHGCHHLGSRGASNTE